MKKNLKISPLEKWKWVHQVYTSGFYGIRKWMKVTYEPWILDRDWIYQFENIISWNFYVLIYPVYSLFLYTLLEVIDMHYYRYLDIKIHPPSSKKIINIKNKSVYTVSMFCKEKEESKCCKINTLRQRKEQNSK